VGNLGVFPEEVSESFAQAGGKLLVRRVVLEERDDVVGQQLGVRFT
jgi:hypothetical protein